METYIPQNNHGDPFLSSTEYHNCLIEAAEFILKRLGVDKIDISIVEGSGLLDISTHLIPDPVTINMSEVPHCPIPTAIGHKQGILYGIINGRSTIIWNGRIHYYEGYRVAHQAFPAYVSAYLGCSVFITTNAAGFINQSMDIGDLALITDHINMTNKPYDGVFYLDQSFRTNKDIKENVFSSSSIYDKEMVDLTRQSFIEAGLRLTEGHYCYYALPNFESPSDIQIMHDLGAATVGASTLPEQIACYLSGMRRVIVSSATSPSSGMSDQEISGEEVLECGRKCVISFAKLLPVLIAKLKDEMFLNKRPNMLLNTKSQLDNLNNERQLHIDTQEVAQKIAKAVRAKVGYRQIQRSVWLMSDQLYQQFIDEHKNESENPIYFINLSDITPMRTRSYQQCQLVLGIFKGELWLIIRQSHLEGMLPYEYSAILKTLNVLNISQTQVYFEASSVNDETLNNKSHHISNLNYFNKRFFKLTETQTFQDHSGEIKSNLHLGVSTQEQQQSQRTLIAYEGTMLPSKTELAFAQKGKFDLYTVTNFSFADLAQHLKVDLVLNAVSKHNLVQAEEIVVPNVFQQEINQASPFTDVQPNQKINLTYEINHTFEIKHSRDTVYETANKVKEIFGVVDNLLVLEHESFQVMFSQLTDQFTIEKVVRFNLKDYQEETHVDAVKIKSNSGQSIIVLSQMLTYQSNVPFQTSLLPMRILILGVNAKNFISCPHVWSLTWEKNPVPQQVGELFILKDHANISAQPPGIGPNLDEYGPRFYDISTMYEKRFVQKIQQVLNESEIAHQYGEVFWVNNKAVPSQVYNNLAEGVSNHRVTFKGLVKTGVNELMAVHHRRNYSEYKLTSAMIGIVTDSVIKSQEISDKYAHGVKNLIGAALQSFNKLNE